ncbi:MAG: D-tyrosyl-tRNA(Tyr) deacylase [Sulfobacillus acidophilus]|uniref:D-aminoacyl-tRNA deacylase n=1 Tax=Sulfobacillus acidophilus TaxID=53633 RepID=A0A2T2WPC9_9FIRM|nr:MAG: D-tyrosyl-tRNA(Tyr) deacylase [Sulfobacillus acidophilus]
MRVVVQRVTEACVTVQDEIVGSIGLGLLVLVGVACTDTEDDASWLAHKVAGLRVFSDTRGKMSLAAGDVGGEYLVVSQFTLFGDVRHGLRPDFGRAAPAPQAERLYRCFCDQLRLSGHRVRMGVFGAHMDVQLVNNGPVTIYIDTDEVKFRGV